MSDTTSVASPGVSTGAAFDMPGQGPSTEKEAPSQTGVRDVDPNTGTTGSDNAGGAQASSEDGQSRATPRKGSAQWDWKSLRQSNRELRAQITEMQDQLRQIREAREAASGNGRTEQPDFWSDPAGTIRSSLEQLREDLRQEMHSTREQDRAMASLASERSEAVEFIHSQPGWSDEDDAELVEIIQDYGLGALPPMRGAQAALAIFNQQRGVGDKSQLKRQASPMVGSPPSAGARRYTEAEMNAKLEYYEKNPAKFTPEVEAEIRDAYRDGRVMK